MRPQRIASLLAGSTEILYALGLADQVVAVSHECDHPPEVAGKPRVTFANIDADRPSGDIDKAVRAESAAGAPLYRIDVERLADLRPDLIVTQAQCEVCAVSLDDVRAAVQSKDELKDAEILALNPNTLDDVFNDILRAGQAARCTARAKQYVASLLARIEAIQRETATLTEVRRPRVVCLEWIDPVMVAANWTPEMIRIAGGRCALTEPGAKTAYTDWNDVVEYDPEVIVVAPCGFELQRTLDEAGRLPQRDHWNDLTAVKSHRVYAADGNAYFNRSGPRLVDTTELLATFIHPARFKQLREKHERAWQPLTLS